MSASTSCLNRYAAWTGAALAPDGAEQCRISFVIIRHPCGAEVPTIDGKCGERWPDGPTKLHKPVGNCAQAFHIAYPLAPDRTPNLAGVVRANGQTLRAQRNVERPN